MVENPGPAFGSVDEAQARRQYHAIQAAGGAGPVTLLHIGAERTVLATGIGPVPTGWLALAIGSSKTAADHFRRDPPLPIEMENAIMAVEDEVTRARKQVAGSSLVTLDVAIARIALIAGVPASGRMTLGIEAVEQTFDRLSGVVSGRPAASEGLPAGSAFAATLLILRELMHHLQFSSITVHA